MSTSPTPSSSRVCRGGPLDGQRVEVDCPDGFLAVDKLAGIAWFYRPTAAGEWRLDTSHDDTLIYPHGPVSGDRRVDWERLPLSTDALPVVSLGDSDEAYAGDPVADDWGRP